MTIEFKIEIDRYRLDDEWVEQPELYHFHAVALEDARMIWEQAKARLEIIKAKTAMSIRDAPETFGLAKVTEKVVEEAVAVQEDVKWAVKVAIKARYDVGVLSAAVEGLQHRKKALEKLVELHSTKYYSEPRAEGAREVMEEVEERAALKKGVRRREKRKQR